MSYPVCESCSVLNKLTLLKFEIHMEELKKKYTPYTESERMSYIREYLSTSETKYQFAYRYLPTSADSLARKVSYK